MWDIQRFIPIIFILIVLSGNIAFAQSSTIKIPDAVYYLVRHAEKDTGKNPVLTTAGYQRTGDLYRQLKDKMIGRIYVNQYRRIQLTADSLRIYQNIDTVHYVADLTGDDLINKLSLRKGREQNVLIIGHSNTIPVIIRRLGISDLEFKEIPDEEYDNLYIVTIKKNKASLKHLKYGKASNKPTVQSKMKSL